MTLMRILAAAAVVQAVCTGVVNAQVRWSNERSINQLTEHIYRFGTSHNSLIVATNEGLIVVDGSCDNMDWFESEISKRFRAPVRYVVLSHDHQDHICGTERFAKTAVGIGQVNIRPHILREKRMAIVPQVLFEDTMEIVLGGIRVVLMYLGPTHSDNMLYVHIPAEGVLFAPDFARGRNILPDFRDLDVHNALKALRTLAYLPDVKIVLEGHDRSTTTQEAFLEFHRYLQAMRDRVLDSIVEGKTLAQIRKEVTMADFADYKQTPERVVAQIETMYDYLWRYREDTSGDEQRRAPRD
jgi:glyoxylase-like metal-dependent hydrolase (beta-lactamase superfamily II)